MRVLVLLVAAAALCGCASDRAAYGEQVATGISAITGPAVDDLGACAKSFVRNFKNKTTDAASLDAALSAYCGKQEAAVELAYFQVSQAYPGVTPAHARSNSTNLIDSLHRVAVGKIMADQLQGR